MCFVILILWQLSFVQLTMSVEWISALARGVRLINQVAE